MGLFTRSDNDTTSTNGSRSHALILNGQEATDATYARIMTAQPHQPTEQEVQRDLQRYQSRSFRFLR
jgi:hypothetical protein